MSYKEDIISSLYRDPIPERSHLPRQTSTKKRRQTCCLGIKNIKDAFVEFNEYLSCIKTIVGLVLFVVVVYYGFRLYGHFKQLGANISNMMIAIDQVHSTLKGVADKVGVVVNTAANAVQETGKTVENGIHDIPDVVQGLHL